MRHPTLKEFNIASCSFYSHVYYFWLITLSLVAIIFVAAYFDYNFPGDFDALKATFLAIVVLFFVFRYFLARKSKVRIVISDGEITIYKGDRVLIKSPMDDLLYIHRIQIYHIRLIFPSKKITLSTEFVKGDARVDMCQTIDAMVYYFKKEWTFKTDVHKRYPYFQRFSSFLIFETKLSNPRLTEKENR